MRAAAVWRDTAQSTTERLWEENLGKDLTHPSATAKTTGTGTTTDQTAGTETNKTDTTVTVSTGSWRSSAPAETIVWT